MEMMETWFRVQKKGKNIFWFGKSKNKNKTKTMLNHFPQKSFKGDASFHIHPAKTQRHLLVYFMGKVDH